MKSLWRRRPEGSPVQLHQAIFAGLLVTFLTNTLSAQDPTLCSTAELPTSVQAELKGKFSSWRVQDVANLAAMTKERWRAEKPLTCPGIAVGKFESVNATSYAVLIVPALDTDSAYKLLVFTPKVPNSIKVLEEWNKGGASHYFIHELEINKVLSSGWIKKLDIKTTEGFVSVDAAESEYGVDVYFWADSQYRHKWIDY